MTSGWLVPHASLELPSGTETNDCIRDQGYSVMQTSCDGIIENFDGGNAEGRLGRQTDQSRAAGAHTLIRSRPDSDRGGAFELQ
jgi:hypothetical protein